MKKKKYNKQSKELNKIMKKYPYYPEQQNNYQLIQNNFKYCEKCPNNPKNNPFATGVCNCALPAQEMFRW